jgi:hypothetical protein
MSILQRQRTGMAVRCFSTRIPEDIATSLEQFAIEKRLTMSATITRLISKSLAAERGCRYVPEGGKNDVEIYTSKEGGTRG